MSILNAAHSQDSNKASKKSKRKHSEPSAGGEEVKKPKKEKKVLKSKNTDIEKDGKTKNFKKEKLANKIADKKTKVQSKAKKGEEKPFVKLDKQQTRDKQRKDKADRKAKKLEQSIYDIGTQAKRLWEEVRKEDCPEEKKTKLVTELHSLLKGNIKKLIYAHDTVRVVECLMATGTQETRDALYEELKDDIIEMSKSKYAHFFVQKILNYGSKEQRAAVMKVFEGKVAKLMKHKIAGMVVELAYNDWANANQKISMLQEFVGPEYRIFKEPELRTVEEICTKYPEKKTELVKNLGANVDTLIKKGCYNHSLVHTVIANYLVVVDGKRRAECIESMRESLVHIIHSRDGAMAALHCLWHGTTKDRKSIVKSLKTFVEKTACEEYGHLVLLAIFDTVDDTKFIGKAIIGELLENVDGVLENKYGLRVIKYLMAGRDKTYIYPDVIQLLEKGDGNEHSKKDSAVRRKELREAAAGQLVRWLQKRLICNLFDPPATITLTCIFNNLPPSAELCEVWTTLAEEAAKPFVTGDDEPNIIENTAGNMLLKKIIIKDKERHASGSKTFSEILLKTLDVDSVESWLNCNRGAFVMVYCWETEIPEIQDLVREKVKPLEKTLKKQKHKGGSILQGKLKK